MTSWARPGVKVVCVDGAFSKSSGDLPVVGRVYTIVWVGHWDWFNTSGTAVHLAEVNRKPDCDGVKNPFGLRRFKPLITRTQSDDVALIKSLLISNPVDAGLVPAGVEFDT